MNRADTAALLAGLDVDRATLASRPAAAPGLTVWSADNRRGGSATVTMPTLRPGAPVRVRRIVRDLALATLTGRCPRCDAVTGHQAEGLAMIHDDGCPLTRNLDRWLQRPFPNRRRASLWDCR